MASFEELAREFGSGFIAYDQADTVGRGSVQENSLNNAYLRTNQKNAGGVCLGLSIAFLFWSKRYKDRQPMVWIDDFMTKSRSAYYDARSGGFSNVSDLQMLIATIAESQRKLMDVPNPPPATVASATAIGSAAREGMWGVALRPVRSITVSWNGRDLTAQVFPRLNDSNYSWVFACYKIKGGGHAMALTSMIHPRTGSRLLVFFEPNYGVAQFQGITAGARFRQFLDGFCKDEGRIYNGNSTIYEFI